MFKARRGPKINSTWCDSKNDEYFSTRDIGSQIAAWTSNQSKEIESLEKMGDSYQIIMDKFQIKSLEEAKGVNIPRPDVWGGYDMWIEEILIYKQTLSDIRINPIW